MMRQPHRLAHSGDMTDERRRPDAPQSQPELEPYLDALGDMRPTGEDSVTDSGAIDDPGEAPDSPAIDEPDRRLEQPGDTATGGVR